MKKFYLFFFVAAQLFALLSGGCRTGESTGDIPAVTSFELPRYLGKWYEIVRLPHSFEKGMENVSAEYTLLDNGNVRVVNSGEKNGKYRQIEGSARMRGAADIGELEVTFFPPFYGDYRIIELAPDYSSAVVTGSTRDYCWILSRTPELPPDVLAGYLDFLAKNGFDTTKLIRGQACKK